MHILFHNSPIAPQTRVFVLNCFCLSLMESLELLAGYSIHPGGNTHESPLLVPLLTRISRIVNEVSLFRAEHIIGMPFFFSFLGDAAFARHHQTRLYTNKI